MQRFLSESKYNANIQNFDGETILHMLLGAPSSDLIKVILKWVSQKKIDFGIRNNNNLTAIQIALQNTNYQSLLYLLNNAKDETPSLEILENYVNTLPKSFLTEYLLISIRMKWNSSVKILLDPQFNQFSKDELISSENILHRAIRSKNLEVFNLLWPIYQSSKLSAIAVGDALECGVLEIYEAFESAGYDMRGHQSYTKAHWAAYHGWLQFLRDLRLDPSFDVNMENEDGETLLHAALKGEDGDKVAQVVNLLLKPPFKINIAELIAQSRLSFEDLMKPKLENLLSEVIRSFNTLYKQVSDPDEKKNLLRQVEQLRLSAYLQMNPAVFKSMEDAFPLAFVEDKEILEEFTALRLAAFREQTFDQIDVYSEPIDIIVNRNNILESTVMELRRILVEGIDLTTSRTNITFFEEDGADGGALTLDFFSIASEAIFNQPHLFEMTGTYAKYVNIKRLADEEITEEMLEMYRFAGMIIGMAILNQSLLGVPVSQAFLRLVLGQSDNWQDIREIDPVSYKTYHDTIFETSEEMFNSFDISYGNLLPDDPDKPVLYADRAKYVSMSVSRILSDGRRRQAEAVREGLNLVIPQIKMGILQPVDLQNFICGKPDIDLDDWKNNTVYGGIYNADHPAIVNFWKVLARNPALRPKILAFVTGYHMVPAGGMAQLKNGHKFTITPPTAETPGNLPVAAACSMHLYYPTYETYEETESALTAASNIVTFDNT